VVPGGTFWISRISEDDLDNSGKRLYDPDCFPYCCKYGYISCGYGSAQNCGEFGSDACTREWERCTINL